MTLRHVTLPLALALALAATVPATATPTWLAPVSVSAKGVTTQQQQVAENAAGDLAAVWVGTDVQAALREAGGAFGEPVDLTPAGDIAQHPAVGLDASGDATVAWQFSTGSIPYEIQAATRLAGGGFASPVTLSSDAHNAVQPELALDPGGDAVAVWQWEEGPGSEVVQAASRTGAGGAWQAPVTLSLPGGSAGNAQVALDPAGEAVAVWTRSNGANEIVQASVHPPGAITWQPPVSLSSSGHEAETPHVAIDAAGEAVVVFTQLNSTDVVQASVHPAGGSFSAPVSLSAPTVIAIRPQVAVDPAGDAIATWQANTGGSIVQAATLPAGGGSSWSAPTDLTAVGETAVNPQVASDAAGDDVVAWEQFGAHTVVQAATRAAGASFGSPVTLSDKEAEALGPAVVASDAEGDAVAEWGGFDGAHYIQQVAGLDFAGPRLAGVAIPARGVAGTPVSFAGSGSVLDEWSGVASSSWSFGDGASAGGLAVSHTYARAGTYPVTLSVTDGAGNTGMQGGTIAIVSPSPGAPGAAVALSGLRVTPSTFSLRGRLVKGRCVAPTHAGGAGRGHRACRRAVSVRVSYVLSLPGSVTVAVARASGGRLVGSRCAAATHANRRGRRCTRRVGVPGTLTLSHVAAGAGAFTFDGRVGGRTLGAGDYVLTLTPEAGGLGGGAQSVGLTVTG